MTPCTVCASFTALSLTKQPHVHQQIVLTSNICRAVHSYQVSYRAFTFSCTVELHLIKYKHCIFHKSLGYRLCLLTLFIYTDQQAKPAIKQSTDRQQSDSKILCKPTLRRHAHFEKGSTRHLADNVYLTVCWKFLEAFLSEMSKQRGGRRICWYIAHSVGHALSMYVVFYFKKSKSSSLMVKSAAFSTHKTTHFLLVFPVISKCLCSWSQSGGWVWLSDD